MKKFILLIILSVFAVFYAEDCKAQYSSLKFGDFGVSSVTPVGRASVNGKVWIDVENPLVGFSVTNVEGRLYRDGVPLIEGAADDYYVPNGTTRLYLPGKASLCPGVTIFDVLGLILFDPALYTVDIKAVITDDGADPIIKEVKDIPVLTLLKKNENKIVVTNESENSK